jgi:hypothetical protein
MKVTAQAPHLAIARTIALFTGAVETFEERAHELEQCKPRTSFSANACQQRWRIRWSEHNHLPERQEKSLSRLRDLNTADGVPNSKNSNEKRRFLR